MNVLHSWLEQFSESLNRSDFGQIKELGQTAARDAFVYDQEDLLEASLLAYSLYKLSQKHYIRGSRDWKECLANVREKIHDTIDDQDETGLLMHELLGQVHALSQRFGRFAQTTVEKGRLRAAAQMYAHGASLTTAAELSGAPLSQAASYIGGTKIAEKYETVSISIRMENIRKVFE